LESMHGVGHKNITASFLSSGNSILDFAYVLPPNPKGDRVALPNTIVERVLRR
jgi:hypothetical protein